MGKRPRRSFGRLLHKMRVQNKRLCADGLGVYGGLSRMTATLPAETTADILIICSKIPEGRVIIIQPMLNTSPASYSYDYQGLHLISNHMA